MITKIHINRLICKASIGITEEERNRPQPLIIDLLLTIDGQKAIDSDHVSETINYSFLKTEIEKIISDISYNLLESLGADITNMCLKQNIVIEAQVSIYKPHILSSCESAGITIIKNRHEHHLS